MQIKSFHRPSLKTILKSSAVAGLAAVMLSTGIPAAVHQSFAQAVKVDAPAVASFADVVTAVSPAVVSVRVETRTQPVSDEQSGFNFDFNGPGFDNLPDDHPLKRFFREFGGPGSGNGKDSNQADGSKGKQDQGKGRLRPTSQGSGFFISGDGYLVTNNHVVDDGAAFTVVLNDGTELDAKLIGKDSRTDLAVLKVDDKSRTFSYVQFADDSKVRVGDWVVAVGNPFGLGGTVTAGIVSARGRDIGAGPYDDFLQVDAAVNRGNSGGPTFNLNGEVVGINTAIFSPSGGGNVGIAFAIPASTAKGVVADLMDHGTVQRGWLGVQIQPVDKDIAESLGLSEASGALVMSPQEGSPGAKAGIRKGDVVTAVNGETVKGPRELAKMIAAVRPGTDVDVSIWRDGKSQSVKVNIGTLPAEQKQASAEQAAPDEQQQQEDTSLASLGISVAPADDGKGLTVTSVDPDSDASDRGLKQGDRITTVNNQEVNSARDIQNVLAAARKDGRKRALFQVEADNGSRFVALPTDKG